MAVLHTWRLLWTLMVIALGGVVVINIVTTSTFVMRVMGRGIRDFELDTPAPVLTPQFDPRFDKYAIGVKTGAHMAAVRVPIQMMTFLKFQPNVFYFSDDDAMIGDILVEGMLKTQVPDNFYPFRRKLLGSSDTVKADQQTIGWKLDQRKHFFGFKEMYKRYPDKDWYIMIDDDTYLFMDNIQAELSKINATQIHYFGTPRMFKNCNGYTDYGQGPDFGQGGAGIVFSRAALEAFLSVVDECMVKYEQPGCVGSVRVALCLKDFLGIKLDVRFWHNFNSMAPNRDLDWRAKACARPMSFHHVTQAQIQDLYRVDVINPHNVLRKKYPEYTNFENVYSQITYSDDTKEKGQQITGGVVVISYQTNDTEYCRKMCRDNPKCMAYSINVKTSVCQLRDMVGKMTPCADCFSGIMGSHYVCVPDKPPTTTQKK
jgi:hypothetical protein